MHPHNTLLSPVAVDRLYLLWRLLVVLVMSDEEIDSLSDSETDSVRSPTVLPAIVLAVRSSRIAQLERCFEREEIPTVTMDIVARASWPLRAILRTQNAPVS